MAKFRKWPRRIRQVQWQTRKYSARQSHQRQNGAANRSLRRASESRVRADLLRIESSVRCRGMSMWRAAAYPVQILTLSSLKMLMVFCSTRPMYQSSSLRLLWNNRQALTSCRRKGRMAPIPGTLLRSRILWRSKAQRPRLARVLEAARRQQIEPLSEQRILRKSMVRVPLATKPMPKK